MYVDNFDEMSKFFTQSINKLKLENETVEDAILATSLRFDLNMVYLSE
jgi:hypothetical protein